MSSTLKLDVAVGVIFDSRGKVFIAKRSQSNYMSDLWEFPGGKIEVGETVLQALTRELDEEIGIHVFEAVERHSLTHEYPGRVVTLHVCQVLQFEGEPHGREGQPIRWVEVCELADIPMPAANHEIIAEFAKWDL